MNEYIDTNKLKAALVEKKIVQRRIAELVGVSRATINSMLANRTIVTADVLAIIARETGYSIDHFLCK